MSKTYHKESFKHKFAKQLLLEWLQKERKIKCYLNKTNFVIQLKNHSVYEEFPFESGCSKQCFQTKPEFEKPFCVFDILVLENQIPRYGFEIVHKHKSNEYKIKRLEEEKQKFNPNFEVYEISAEWILRLVSPPKSLRLSKKLC